MIDTQVWVVPWKVGPTVGDFLELIIDINYPTLMVWLIKLMGWPYPPLETTIPSSYSEYIHLGCSIGSAYLSRVVVGRVKRVLPMRQKCILDFRRNRTCAYSLGGGNSYIFGIFTPKNWGRLPFWRMFFKGVETTNYSHGRCIHSPNYPSDIWMGPNPNGTPKSSIFIGFFILNHPCWVPLFLATPTCSSFCIFDLKKLQRLCYS